jgi:hypothetical protein
MDYTIYSTDTGLIKSEGTSQGLTSLNQIILESGEGIIEGSYDRTRYKILNGVPTEYTPDIFPIIRNVRNGLLEESDWTQVNDSPLSDTKKAEWATYRQALRDLPANNTSATSIDDVTFPTQPS